MAKVILFGGGDAGGLIITANGVRPIPPFEPSLRLKIKGLSALINGHQKQNGEVREMTTLVNKMSNLIVEQVEAVVGPLEGDNSFIFQDQDGGFSCGSTGKRPIPIPWPPKKSFSIGELITTGALDREIIDIISLASNKGLNIQDVFESPAKFAKQLGLNLSERSISDLHKLAPSQIKNISDPVEKEIVQLFNKVVQDGNFIETWALRPFEVAGKLNVKLSDLATDRIIAGGTSAIDDCGTRVNPIVVGVIVGVVILLTPGEAGRGRFDIEDLSGLPKF